MKNNTILIVEDEPVNIAIYKELLAKTYELKVAMSGSTAKKILRNQIPDLILLDIMLLDANGVDICREIKSNPRTEKIPVIIVTTLDNTEEKLKALEAGANDYLNKPIQQYELTLKIRNHLHIKNLSEELNHSYESMLILNNVADSLMNSFNPERFEFESQVVKLAKNFIQEIKNIDELPSYLVISVKEKDNKLNSIFFYIEKSEIVKMDTFFINGKLIDIKDDCKDLEIKNDADFSNFKDKTETIENYQKRFSPHIQKKIGTIKNYMYYFGRKVYIAGFNYTKPVNRFMAQILKSFTIHSNFIKAIEDQHNEVKNAYIYALNALARAAEANDEMTGAHILRVNHYSRFIAEELKLDPSTIYQIFISAQMHDIGKIHIHPNILTKTGQLTETEWAEIRKHPEYGAMILGKSEYMKVARNICLRHHENFDGSGYPKGLKGDAIPIEARIVHLADVYDSIRSKRTYKPEFSHQRTCEIILDGDNRTKPQHFDPEILEIFRKNKHEFNKIFKSVYEKV